MELSILFVKSNIANAVATAIIGTLFGPLFPACLSVANDILPSEVQMISMALMYVLDAIYWVAQIFDHGHRSAGGSLGAGSSPDPYPKCDTDVSAFFHSDIPVHRRNDFK